MKRFSSPASSAISTLAPSMVPMVRAPFSMNFMFPVPDASVPAVEICSDRSVAGITANRAHSKGLAKAVPKDAGQQHWCSPIGRTLLCQGDPVVLQEDDLQLAPHNGVVVDHLGHGVDELDDHFGHVVPWGSLGAEPWWANWSAGDSLVGHSEGFPQTRLTLPPMITVLGTKSFVGSLLMPGGEGSANVSCVPSPTHPLPIPAGPYGCT